MEGPSLFLAKEQLKPFKKKRILSVSGNTKIGKERLEGRIVKDIFSWGKHLVFQFDDFAMRVHFMLFGTFEAVVDGKRVTGDYKRTLVPRLGLAFPNGEILMFNCSIKFIENAEAKGEYDFTTDVMSKSWDPNAAYKKVRQENNEQIADVLLDQDIFSGVGNIIKNEVLSLAYANPKTKVEDISPKKLKEIITLAHSYSQQFYAWRKKFVLTKNLKIHRRAACPHCGVKVIHEKTGKRQRISHYCPVCQKG
jgi:endonuclease VIII